jgi:hypothetical protein
VTEELPRLHLKQLLQRHGTSLVDEPAQCGDLLLEALGDDYRREVSLIETAAEEGIGRELINSSALARARVPQLTARLARDRGLSPQASRWAVESWAFALGVELPSQAQGRWRAALSLIGGAALVGSSFAPWGFGHPGYKIGVDILWTKSATVRAGLFHSIGLVTLALGVIALLGLLPKRGWPTTLAGFGGLLVFVSFLITHSIRAHFPGTALDYGAFLVLGGVLALPAAFIGVRPRTTIPVQRPRHAPQAPRTTSGPPAAG